MLNEAGFDLWADGYEESVDVSDENNSYPFAGYKKILNRICGIVAQKKEGVVLDIGFGTGVLAAKLYELGFEIWGQDFSEKMIEHARAKMPGAHLFQGDFSKGLAEPLLHNTYDFIIATYSLHHLQDEEKINLIGTLRKLLSPQGKILIGDVAFDTVENREKCRIDSGDEWDEEEIYFVWEEIAGTFPDMKFEKVSDCSGILSLGY